MGEELAVWIKLNEGHSLVEGDIKQFCKGKVSIQCFEIIGYEICFISAVTFQDSQIY